MTNRNKTIIAAASVTLVAILLVLTKKKKKYKEQLLDAIADEGYETAHDILSPLRARGSNRYW